MVSGGNASNDEDEDSRDSDSYFDEEEGEQEVIHEGRFSWLEYSIFLIVGVAMLWAWNMFLAAAPYFSSRLADSPTLQRSSQSSVISVSTMTNLVAMYALMKIQYSADYPFRINSALAMNVGVFVLLTLSTWSWVDDYFPTGVVFAFLLVAVAVTAWASGLMQNGAFAFAASFGRPEYTQAIMVGQAISGVLPPLTQMASVLLVPSSSEVGGVGDETSSNDDDEEGTAAFIYFLTAVLVSLFALVVFQPLVARHNKLVETRVGEEMMTSSFHSIQEAEQASRKVVGMFTLWHKLRWVATSVALCFLATMFFPVFTSRVVSVRTTEGNGDDYSGNLANPNFFIPLAFFFWNLGDFLGRTSSMLPAFSLLHRQRHGGGHAAQYRHHRTQPYVLFVAAVLRGAIFLPLYALCNVDGAGAIVESDWFYLLFVQFPFGLTNGWVGSNCMMVAGEYVEESEREAAGGFMGFALVVGLTVGSILSFAVPGA